MAGLDQETINLYKRHNILKQLVTMLHAKKCMERERRRQRQGFTTSPCTVASCSKMRLTITHLASCTFEPKRMCPASGCYNTRKIMNHWNGCSHVGCTICGPLADERQREAYGIPIDREELAWSAHQNFSL